MLYISSLNKTYPNGVKALSDITLKIDKGMFGLLGPNGAGKSSLMRTIATLQEPDSGSIIFDALNILEQKDQMRKILGYLPQEFGVYPTISAEDLLNHLAILKGLDNRKKRKEEIDYLLEVTNLSEHRRKNLGTYSGGMKQRFGIAQALIGNPKIIIVDEPVAGLDPEERDRFHNLLSTIGDSVIVILSTHIVSDVTELCNDMAIINHGKLLIQKSPLEAIELLKGKIWKKIISKSEKNLYSEKFQVISSRLFHGQSILKVFSDVKPDTSFDPIDVDLEDVYFSFIKNLISL